MTRIGVTLILTAVILGASGVGAVGAATPLEEIQAPPSLPSLKTGPPPLSTPLPSLDTGPPSLDTPLPSMDSGPPPLNTPLPSLELEAPAVETPLSPDGSAPAEPTPQPEEEVPPG